jgi:hypothetical protein
MRGVNLPIAVGILVAIGTTAAASSPKEPLFTPNSSGCAAAEAGALDLHVKLTPVGTQVGMAGSGLVTGFVPGDRLTFVRRSKAGSAGLRDTLSLSALVPGEPGRIVVVFALTDMVLSVTQTSEESAKFVIPHEGATWALFTGSMGEGEGEYMVTVRCEPGSPSRSPPLS